MAGHTRRRHGNAHGNAHGGAHGGAPGGTHGPRADGWLTGRALVAAALVVAALLLVPWLAGRLTPWGPARAAAVLVALPPALYHWFRAVQRVRPRTAAVLSIAYGILAAGIVWALTAA